jgi:hypothetical protein
MRLKSIAPIVLSSTSLALAACSAATSGSPHPGGGTSASVSAAAAADPLAAMTASQIISKATADLSAASSVRMSGTTLQSGTITIDLTMGRSKCFGTISEGSKGSFELIKIGKSFWIKPDHQFWTSSAGASGVGLGLLEGKYIRVSSSTTGMGSFSQLCDPSQLAAQIHSGAAAATKSKTTTVNGQSAVELTVIQQGTTGTAYVSVSATPEFLEIAAPGQGRLDFTDYNNAAVTVTPPPASETIDGSKYGF